MSVASRSNIPLNRPGRRRDAAHRRDLAWIASLVHRLSGLGLAIFLPMHFMVLALALNGPQALDGFLQWTHQPVVKLAEAGLVALLVAHLLGHAVQVLGRLILDAFFDAILQHALTDTRISPVPADRSELAGPPKRILLRSAWRSAPAPRQAGLGGRSSPSSFPQLHGANC